MGQMFGEGELGVSVRIPIGNHGLPFSVGASDDDPKLSDGGGWRDGCMVGGKAEEEAGAVANGAVRCPSAGTGP